MKRVHSISILLVGFALALGVGTTAGTANSVSSFNVLVEEQVSSVKFSVQGENVISVRVAVLSLGGKQMFDSNWVTDQTVAWPLVTRSGRSASSGVYLYAISVRDRAGKEEKKLGKLALVYGREQGFSVPSVSDVAQVQPTSLPSGVKWKEQLGADSQDNFRILRRPGSGQAFQNLLTLDNAGKLSVAALCLNGVCNSSWPSVVAAGGWVDDGSVVRLENSADKVGIGTASPQYKLHVAGGGARFELSSTSKFSLGGEGNFEVDAVNVVGGRFIVTNSGNVGIGAASPLHLLQIGGGFDGNLGFDGSDESPNAGFIRFGDNTGWKLFLGRQREMSAGPLNTGPTGAIMTLQDNGNVGIGLTNPGQTLEVTGTFQVTRPNHLFTLFAANDRTVAIGALAGTTTKHACYFGTYYFGDCSSAAEYVPTVDTGSGYPEATDLVSILPKEKNPYGDDHGPFIVAKTSTPCDENLIGYILDPKSGADGKKLNDHYLPLAIYGYFPAKVTMENGPIKRGDPITSSSKPGYGMKATSACKVIGYALEDADKEGTIQVFSHLTEYAAPEVTRLQERVKTLEEQLQQVLSQLQEMRTQEGSKGEPMKTK
ncbi:hypothetical protein HY230_10490 [Candidatus Acetothermia bacterium]|nr:hypothetical protein [Candidatus Acetothermia bacterium]